MVSNRCKNITPSATVSLNAKVAELRAAGVDVIAFNVGEPDFDTPETIVDACVKALNEGKTKYTAAAGILPLRKAIGEKLKKDNDVVYTPKQICVSTGAKQALQNALLAIINPGDEVILPIPCWVSYIELIKLADGVPVTVPTNEPGGFQLDIAAIKAAVTPRTRAVLINTPNNPTGAVYNEQDLRALGELAVRHNFYIISDEVYEKLIYGDAKHICVASLSPEIYDHSIVVNGFSKAYSMTGWRVGYTAAPQDIATAIDDLQGHTTSNSTSFAQYACVAALLPENDAAIEDMKAEFRRRRDYLLGALRALPGVTCADADGAFYLMPNISGYYGRSFNGKMIRDSFDFCDFILEEAKVAIVPGAAFESPDNVRITYSNSMQNLGEGVRRIAEALKKLA